MVRVPSADVHAANHSYIYLKRAKRWPASSINARLPKQVHGDKKIAASAWLDKNRPVEQITWGPGYPELIKDKLIIKGRLIDTAWAFPASISTILQTSNSAIRPRRSAGLIWSRRSIPTTPSTFINFFAQRVQHPEIKINHGSGARRSSWHRQGHARRAVEACRRPSQLSRSRAARRYSENSTRTSNPSCSASPKGRDLGDINRYAFYERMQDADGVASRRPGVQRKAPRRNMTS